MARASARMYGTPLRFGYLPTIVTITKVTPNNLDILFQDKKFEILISRKHLERVQYVK